MCSSASARALCTFDILHPDPMKAETHRLRDSFAESPTRGDNIYQFQGIVAAEAFRGAIHEIALPDYWPHLKQNRRVWVSAHGHFGQSIR